MIYFINPITDPYYNMALDECLLKSNLTDDIFMLWRNFNTIVIGRNQNTIEEINHQAVEKDQVNVVRRSSGGGAVFQDEGNLCFSIILTKTATQNYNYEAVLQPIINVLRKLGLNAQFAGKNDIEIDGKKISGNAQVHYKNRLLHHGTFLFDVDLTKLGQYLNVDPQKIISKGIKSTPARVVNIKALLKEDLTIEQFIDYLMKEFSEQGSTISTIPAEIVEQAKTLADTKYRTWEWNYGKSPEFSVRNKIRFEGKGTIDARINVENGKIKNAKFYGDFLGTAGTEKLEQALENVPYTFEKIQAVINQQNYQDIFGPKFTGEEIISTIIN